MNENILPGIVRTSKIPDINRIRKELWESIYSSFSNLKILTNHITDTFSEAFGFDVIDNLNFDFNEMTISLNLLRPISNVKLNAVMSVAYSRFIKDMYINNKLAEDEYNICLSRPDMLFILTLNTEKTATIKL